MNRTIEDIQNDFIDRIGETAEGYGMTRGAGLLKGLLLVSRNPLSLDEMAERLEMSKASVSTNIRLLERWRVVRRVFNRGDRKNYYELWGDLWEMETEIVTNILRDELKQLADFIAKSRKDLEKAEGTEPEDKAFLAKRLGEIDEYLDAVTHLLQLLTREGKVSPATIRKIQIG